VHQPAITRDAVASRVGSTARYHGAPPPTFSDAQRVTLTKS
jgi:hypothetical protein